MICCLAWASELGGGHRSADVQTEIMTYSEITIAELLTDREERRARMIFVGQ